MRKHDMKIIKVEHSETIDHCPNCPYAEKVQGLFDAYRCSQGVLEGPLYERDGCNLLGWVQSGLENYDAELEVTACSTILGEKLEPKATPETEPGPEPETGEAPTHQYQEGATVELLPWEWIWNGFWKGYFRPTDVDRKQFGLFAKVVKVNSNASQAKVQLSPETCCWWPITALRLASLKKGLQPYPDLGRLPQVGEEVKILIGAGKGRHGTVVSVAVYIARVECEESGASFNYSYENLAPLDQ